MVSYMQYHFKKLDPSTIPVEVAKDLESFILEVTSHKRFSATFIRYMSLTDPDDTEIGISSDGDEITLYVKDRFWIYKEKIDSLRKFTTWLMEDTTLHDFLYWVCDGMTSTTFIY